MNLSAQKGEKQAKDTIRDNSIILPESLNEQLALLLHDWQLDFSKSENKCRQGVNVLYHDSVYTNRLFKLPSEMELSYNQVVRSYIDMYANRRRELVSYMLSLGDYYFPMFEEALDRYGLPLELKYLPVIESALNPVAVSRMGATGLWQFMLKTGKGYGLEVNSLVDERRDPYKATDAAARYLRDLYSIYGDWNLVIAAYNCGPGNVNKAIARTGGKNDYWQIYYGLPRETRGYVPAFIAANYIMNYYPKHNICPMEAFGSMNALDTIHVSEEMHFAQISAILDIPIDEIRRLNPQFKKDIIPGNYQPYSLVLPTNKTVAFINKKKEISGYRKDELLAHRPNTDEFVKGGDETSANGTSENVYYRVRKGDNISKIAHRNGVTVAQIKSWNGLKSTRLVAGKRLVVKKKKTEPAASSQPLAQRQKTASDTTSNPSGGIIAQYLNKKLANQSQHRDTVAVEEEKVVTAAASGAIEPEKIKEAASKPATKNVYYRVRKGDNLSKIAQRNGVTIEQLKSWNGLKSTKLTVGDQLEVNRKKVSSSVLPKSGAENVPDNTAATGNPSAKDSTGNIISRHFQQHPKKSGQIISEDSEENGVVVSEIEKK